MNGIETGTAGGRPGVGRRTLAKGATWAVPAIAVAGSAPAYAGSKTTTTSTTLPPCLSNISSTGGTYPVDVPLSGCSVTATSSHWDFNFKITAATRAGTDCDCDYLRITLFDNPGRTRLWISNGFGSLNLSGTSGNPQNRTTNDPRLYVQKVLAAGDTGTFPATNDAVRRVGGSSPYTGWEIGTGTAAVGTITAPGTSDDSMHTLMLPGGDIPTCNPAKAGPMAYYRVDCGTSATGPWTQLGDLGEINQCVPMIQATVCRPDTSGKYRLGISVLNSCGDPASSFRITNIQRNSDTNFPNNGSSVWSGNQQLGTGSTDIEIASGSGDQLWISFTTDGGVNTSRIRVQIPTNPTTCVGGCASAPAVPSGASACKVSGTADANSIHRYSWPAVTGATSYDVQYSSSISGAFTLVTGVTSPYTALAGVRRLQVRAVNACGASNFSVTTNVSYTTTACTGRAARSTGGTSDPVTTHSGAEAGKSTPPETPGSSINGPTEPSTTETGGPTPSQPPTGSGG